MIILDTYKILFLRKLYPQNPANFFLYPSLKISYFFPFVLGRSAAYESIIRGDVIRRPNIPASFNVLISELKALALNVELMRDGVDSEKERRPRRRMRN